MIGKKKLSEVRAAVQAAFDEADLDLERELRKIQRKPKPNRRGLRPEYDLVKLRGGVRGKHYKSYQAGTNLALLAADVRAAFPTDEAVNNALRGLMKKRSS
jgi:hypothetical protein